MMQRHEQSDENACTRNQRKAINTPHELSPDRSTLRVLTTRTTTLG